MRLMIGPNDMMENAIKEPRQADIVRIELDLPPRECSPNARGHYSKRARAAKAYRDAAYLLALQAQSGRRRRWELATLGVVFFMPNSRRRDEDNAIASLKPAIDGLVDAEVIVDDATRNLIRRAPVFTIDRKRPRVVLTLEGIE